MSIEKERKILRQYEKAQNDLELNVDSYVNSINYVIKNSKTSTSFLSLLDFLNLSENSLLSKMLILELERQDDKNLSIIFKNFSLDDWKKYVLLHDSITGAKSSLKNIRSNEKIIKKTYVESKIEKVKTKLFNKKGE